MRATNCLCCRLVSGAGDIKITKDGKVLLDEMVGNHPQTLLTERSLV